MTRACFACGLVDDPAARLCPQCGSTLYDADSAEGRECLEAGLVFRRQQAQVRWVWPLMAVVIPVAVALALLTLGTQIILLAIALVGMGLAELHRRRRRSAKLASLEARIDPPAWERRIATGVPALLCAAVTLCFVASLAVGLERWVAVVALDPPALRAGQRLWTLGTHVGGHLSLVHLLNNCGAILLFGVVVDLRVGRRGAAMIVLAAAMAGGALQAAFMTPPAVGASGVAYGLMGASLALLPRRRMLWAPMGMPLSVPAWVLLPPLIGLYTLLDVAVTDGVAWVAHLGGLVAGTLVALALRWVPEPAGFAAREERRAARLAQLGC